MIEINNHPIINDKDHSMPSVFTPENLLREARRQKSIPEGPVPGICILDPDGDIVQNLIASGQAKINPHWACYHTQMYNFTYKGLEFGIVGNAVGASFAVLVAEEMFACGCNLLVSMTSAGQIVSKGTPPYFVLIEKALRDEGTSYHYQPPSKFSIINPQLLEALKNMLDESQPPIFLGATWTTDAPFRETETAIDDRRSQGILGVEMEASALYAFARAKEKPVVCFAHITNQMGNVENDFEKGEAQGSRDAIEVIYKTAEACQLFIN
ncbi:MAG TPA: nucleoside phosphorylase [Anaerolineales bacterium]|nr:nucleoside phosphorylase [Anaerolineales bacterium]HRK89169.1 nucleoside phosphorylase [Anaerolineales bacterium]